MEKERATFAADKKTLEDTIIDITNAEASSRTDQATRDAEIREQAERAKAAEEKYAREVVAHADSLKVVDGLKSEINTLRAQVREHSTSAETAQAKLAASEGSWAQQREALDKELTDVQKRYVKYRSRCSSSD
jgi:nucleoprotein TPR